jgi:hypothetical protein
LRKIVACCNKYKNNNINIIIIIIVLELQKVPKPTTKIHNIRTKTSTTPHPSKGGSLVPKQTHKKGQKRRKKTIDGSRRQKFVKPQCTTRPYIYHFAAFDTNYIIFKKC